MAEQESQHHGALGRRLAFIALWLLAEAAGAVFILMAVYLSIWILPGLGMETDAQSWVVLSALFATPPVMALAMLASLIFAVRGRRRGALVVLVPGYCLGAVPFVIV